MLGPYETLMQALQASAFLSGVTVEFGEEMIAAQDVRLPAVIVVPRGGPAQEPMGVLDGTNVDPEEIDPFVETSTEFGELFQFYCRAQSTDSTRQKPLHHAEATRALRLKLLSALRDQTDMMDANGQVYRGLKYKVLSSDWARVSDIVGRDDDAFKRAMDRFGRALVLSVRLDIPEVMAAPTSQEQTVETTEFDPSVNYSIG